MNRFNLSIPNIFWAGAAISMVIISIGISFSLIRGSEFNVEALDTKLELSGITSKNKELTQELKQVSQELKKTNPPSEQLKEIEVIAQELEKAAQEIEELEEEITDEDSQEKDEASRQPTQPDNLTEN